MPPDFERCWRAVRSRDTRFDGVFFCAVVTTGIYCRPSCPGAPKRRNVRFFGSAAQAAAAGFRACKRCRPDATPGSPDWDVRADVVGRAVRLVADGALDMAGVATAAGFTSVRQFNDTIRAIFDRSPSQLRAASRPRAAAPGAIDVRLAVRTPFDGAALLDHLGAEAVPGVEDVDATTYRRGLRLPRGTGTVALRPAADHVVATLALDDVRDLTAAVHRCRRLLDLDADPEAVREVLAADDAVAPLVAKRPGLRVPGHADPHELAVRAGRGPTSSCCAGSRIPTCSSRATRAPSRAWPGSTGRARSRAGGRGAPTR